MKNLIVVVVSMLALAGCSTTKDWSATGGSRADGVVRLSFMHGQYEKPVLNEDQAVAIATKRCATWGYTGAEAFGGTISQCNQVSGFGCAQFIVTKEYQCLGQGNGQPMGVHVETPAQQSTQAEKKEWF